MNVLRKCKMVDVTAGLKLVREQILAASAKRPPGYEYYEPRLVAVSKMKPPELIINAYEAGQRHFGENYINELLEKGHNIELQRTCRGIKWHFIGRVQKNKVNKLLTVPNLYIIETVDNAKLATALNNAWENYRGGPDVKLKVMVQVNTSQEEAKNGCDVTEVSALVKHIMQNCKNLEFTGLMTIGMFGYDLSKGPNPDYLCLKKCREDVCAELQLDIKNVELSMGMSNDFEHAIELGSTNVRVGSAIFGERPKKGATDSK